MLSVLFAGAAILGLTVWLLFTLPEGSTVTGQRYRSLSSFDAHPSLMFLWVTLVLFIGGAGLSGKDVFSERQLLVWSTFIAIAAAIVWTMQFFEALGLL